MSTPRPAEPSPPPARTRLFATAAVVLPLVAFLLTEGVLRMAGVGVERRDPFVPIPGQEGSVALAPEFGAQFFRAFTPGIAFDPIAEHKASGTLRVFALGGSTTAGFPYSFPYAFPSRLEDRLAAALPGRRVEVANLGMTATNSFTVRALAEPVVEMEPDAVVIYAGHNEYYGAYGAGSTQGVSGGLAVRRFVIGASRWALVAGLGSLLGGGEAEPESRSMMARVVRDASIARGGDVYDAGIEQYEANLRDALETFDRAGVPVYLATLASNLAGQAPLGDEPEAAAAYGRGRELLVQGDSASARAAFLEAKELDGIRFRAPEAVNEVVRRLADEFRTVTLVDVQARLRAASPNGIEGDALFTDHLHPSALGYALMADAFAEAMLDSHSALRDAIPPGPSPSAVDAVEEGVARLQLAALTGGYPFRKDRTPAEAEAAARDVAATMAEAGGPEALAVRVALDGLPQMRALDLTRRDARARADTLAALRADWALLHWQPFNGPLMEDAVGYALANPRFDTETSMLARFATVHDRGAFSLNALAAVSLRDGDLARAEHLLDAAEQVDATSPEMLFNRARLLVMRGDTVQARDYFERYQSVR